MERQDPASAHEKMVQRRLLARLIEEVKHLTNTVSIQSTQSKAPGKSARLYFAMLSAIICAVVL